MNPYLVYVENGYIRFSIGEQHFELHYDTADRYELESMRGQLYKALSNLRNNPHKDTQSVVSLRELEKAEPIAWGMEEDGKITDLISVSDRYGCMKRWAGNYPIPLYRHPPRPVVRLSDDEVYKINLVGSKTFIDIARAIEAAVLKANGLGGEG